MLWVGLATLVAGVVIAIGAGRLATETGGPPSVLVQGLLYLLGTIPTIGAVLVAGSFVVRALTPPE